MNPLAEGGDGEGAAKGAEPIGAEQGAIFALAEAEHFAGKGWHQHRIGPAKDPDDAKQ